MGPLLRRCFTLNAALVALLSCAAAFAAQDAPPPAHIAIVDGSATLERERGIEAATPGLPMIPGDRLRTSGGRVELLFPDGSVLDVDEYTTIDMQSETLLRLAGGRLLLIVAGAADPASALRYQVDTPVASARNEGPGEFRLAMLDAPSGRESELAVLRGAAYLTTENGSSIVRAGERSLARENALPSSPQIFNSARFDDFDRWTSARRNERLGSTSTQYLPRDLQMYGGTFDRNGGWQYEPSYGYVWFPTVSVGWRPYYNGYWTSVRPYGWTWIGLDSWGWPTHHYGRWGVSRSRWFWIPDRHWSPAWVSWAAAPGYVSWCPLGFDNRPVFSLTIGSHNAWAGWVLLPRTHFGTPGRVVRQYAVASPSFSPHAPLVIQATPPVPSPARAVPRSSLAAATALAAAPRASTTGTVGGVPIPDATRGRAVPRREAPLASVSGSRTVESPVFKLPMPDMPPRSADGSSASSSRPTIAVPGARPSTGGDRLAVVPSTTSGRESANPRPEVLSPSMPQLAQPRVYGARPRSDANTSPSQPRFSTPDRLSVQPAPQAAPSTRPSIARPSEGSQGSRGSVGSQGSASSPGSAASQQSQDAQSAQPRAGSRSAPAQPAAAPAPSAGSAAGQGAPAGARTAHRR